MTHFRVVGVGALVVAALSLSGCGSGVSDGGPRVSTVPAQSTSGGTTFTLDLATYVTEPEGNAVVFTVTSGGGTFSGSTYSHIFDTLGEYSVTFSVQDSSSGKTASGTFTVTVMTAQFAVVQNGDDLQLLDTATQKFLPVAGANGFSDTFKASLPTGQVIYERTGSTTQLFVYDPNTRRTFTLGASASYHTTYADTTSDGRVVFVQTSVTNSSDTDLFIWNAATQFTRAIAATLNKAEGNPIVTGADLVYYEKAASPSDIYYYDPSTDTSTAAATGSTAETLRAALQNGGVVLSRIGGGGESDLFYFHADTGLVEIGADLGATILAQTKTYKGKTTDNKVVFEVTGANLDLYIWDSASGASRAIATNGVDDTFVFVTTQNEVVYNTATGGSDNDLSMYNYGTNTSTAISPVDGVNDLYQGALSNGDVVFLRETGAGDDLYLFDTSGGSSAVLAAASASDYSFDAVLINDKVVYSLAGGVYVVNTTGAPSPQTVAAANAVYAGETTGGDFVVQTTVAAQTDLVLWDESGVTTVTISNTTGNDTFGKVTMSGEILFSRVTAQKTTSDLFLWNQGTGEVQLTDTTVNHAVVATYAADNS